MPAIAPPERPEVLEVLEGELTGGDVGEAVGMDAVMEVDVAVVNTETPCEDAVDCKVSVNAPLFTLAVNVLPTKVDAAAALVNPIS